MSAGRSGRLGQKTGSRVSCLGLQQELGHTTHISTVQHGLMDQTRLQGRAAAQVASNNLRMDTRQQAPLQD